MRKESSRHEHFFCLKIRGIKQTYLYSYVHDFKFKGKMRFKCQHTVNCLARKN